VDTYSNLTILEVDESTMNLLSTLRVTSKNNLGIRALAQNLLGQASHSTSTLSSARAEGTTDSTSNVRRVRDTLSCNIVLSKGGLQSFLKSWTNGGAHVTNLSGSTSEDVSYGLANTADDIVLGRTTQTAAEAGEAAKLRSSKRCCEGAGGSEAGNEERLHVGQKMGCVLGGSERWAELVAMKNKSVCR
jgi:hypothetical protein